MNRSFVIYTIKILIRNRHEYSWEKTSTPYTSYYDEVFSLLPIADQKELKKFYHAFITKYKISLNQAERYLYMLKLMPRRKFMLKTRKRNKFGYIEVTKKELNLKAMESYLRMVKVWCHKKIKQLCDMNELDFREVEESFPKG